MLRDASRVVKQQQHSSSTAAAAAAAAAEAAQQQQQQQQQRWRRRWRRRGSSSGQLIVWTARARMGSKLCFASCQKETKKKSVTAGLYEDPDRLVVVKKRGCDWVACGRPRRFACGRPRRRDLATSLALRVQPRRGRTRTRARPSRLRAIAGRKPRDETRPSGGEIAEKRL